MEPKFSVKFANIYVYKFIEQFLQHSYTGYRPPFFGRLVDDIFFFGPLQKKNYYYFTTILTVIKKVLNSNSNTL